MKVCISCSTVILQIMTVINASVTAYKVYII